MGGGVGGRRVQLGQRVVVDGSVLGSDAVAAVAVSLKRRRGGRWSIGSKWSYYSREGRRLQTMGCGVGGGRFRPRWEVEIYMVGV